MRREGIDESNVQMSDVLCDFCHRAWSEHEPMVEGHQGSCLCGRCLSVAYRSLVLHGMDTAPEPWTCTLCLENPQVREELGRGASPGWQSPAYPEAIVCRRCVKQAGGILHKDASWEWTKPVADAEQSDEPAE